MSRQTSRRSILSWMLFDWANQPFHTLIITFIFAPYFVSVVVGDPVVGQALWGAAAAVAGALTAILSPVLGAVADRTGARKPWVLAFSLPFVVGCCGLWLAAPGSDSHTFVLAMFVLAFVGSEFTLLFTNAMLPDLGDPAETGRISGSGWALGYLGGLLSLVLVLTLLSPAPDSTKTLIGIDPVFGLDIESGEPARATGPLSALWYVIFALPFFWFTRDSTRSSNATSPVRNGLRDLLKTLREVRRHRSLFVYLMASMVYRDALAALFAFGGIYAAGVLGWGMFQLGIFGIVAAGTGAAGAWIGGRADEAWGPRPVIVTSIWLLILVCSVTLLTDRSSVLFVPVAEGSNIPDLMFFCAGGVLGAAAGSLQAASRTLLVRQAQGRVGSAQAFGLYALSGRATSFIGPALIAITTTITGSQRVGVSPVIVLFLIGLVLLKWVDAEKRADRSRENDL